MPPFLREVLVNYASNMIRIILNNCTFFWKQREFLHGLDNLQKLVSVGAIRSFIFDFFAIQNFSRNRKAVLLCKWIALILQVKFRFMVHLVKANALVSGNIASSLSSQLSLVQMKEKMVLSCLKLKQNSFKPLKQSMCTFTTKAF